VKNLQMVLTTHSPLLLGDIPCENILFLPGQSQETPATYEEMPETFGQNIHTILKHSFFLEKGTVGDFAANRINLLAKRLRDLQEDRQYNIDNPKEQAWIRQNIDLVAPGILRSKLEQLYQSVYHNYEKPNVEHIVEEARDLSPKELALLMKRLQEQLEDK
jgi:hypothetical protein